MSTSHPGFSPEDAEIAAKLPVQGAEPDQAPDGTPLPKDDNDPGTSEAEAALAAAGAPTPEPTAEAPATTPAVDATTAPAPAAAPAGDAAPSPAPAPHDGNVKAALRASRQNEKRLRQELEAVRAEAEALRQGKATGNDTEDLTDEEIAEIEDSFPLQAKVAKQNRQLKAQIEETRRLIHQQQQEPSGFQPPAYAPEVQEVIDTVPDLLAWQHSEADQDKFAMATEFDTSLKAHPLWKSKSLSERFAEAARLTREATGAAAPAAPSPSAAPAAPRTDPASVIANAPVQGPKGVGDFRGGGPATAPAIDYRRMSDQDILASLPVTD